MGKRLKDIKFKKKVKYDDGQDEYVIKMKKKRNYWWLLLLLLPLLLLIPVSRDITVHTVDAETGTPIPDLPVQMTYTEYAAYKEGTFLYSQKHFDQQTTDAEGKAVFKDIKCSVFSYIFHPGNKAFFVVDSECRMLDEDAATCKIHFTYNHDLKMVAKRNDVTVVVVDDETDQPIAGAKLDYQYNEDGSMKNNSTSTLPDGQAVLQKLFSCGSVEKITATCYGYEDYTAGPLSVKDLAEDKNVIRMKPVKESFTYKVINKESKEPIPGATCEVTLTDGARQTRGKSTTNVDGQGIGVYQNGFILAKVHITASKKPNFKDGELQGDYTVDQFAKLPDEKRVIELEPLAYAQEFENVDSLTGKPIAGVKNVIKVTDFDGNTTETLEMSNTNGKFTISAKEGYKIEIISTKDPDYKQATKVIAKFAKAEKVPLSPNFITLKFRTVDEETNDLVPNCTLEITTSVSNISQPKNSGNGEFTVSGLIPSEQITIVASKSGYGKNGGKVNKVVVSSLMNASQDRRDIPMVIDLPPCNFKEEQNDGKNPMVREYSLKKRKGKFVLRYNTEFDPDHLLVYNCPKDDVPNHQPIWQTTDPATGKPGKESTQNQWRSVELSFDNPFITIMDKDLHEGSIWHTDPQCPQ